MLIYVGDSILNYMINNDNALLRGLAARSPMSVSWCGNNNINKACPLYNKYFLGEILSLYELGNKSDISKCVGM